MIFSKQAVNNQTWEITQNPHFSTSQKLLIWYFLQIIYCHFYRHFSASGFSKNRFGVSLLYSFFSYMHTSRNLLLHYSFLSCISLCISFLYKILSLNATCMKRFLYINISFNTYLCDTNQIAIL